MRHPTIDDTMELAAKLHRGQRDKAGVPYMCHLTAVMRQVPVEAWHVALLHDAVEDGRTTTSHLILMDYYGEELEAILLLTKGYAQGYDDYIRCIAASGNQLAITVKIADLTDNLDLSRLTEITDKDRKRTAKYNSALTYLLSQK